MTLQSFVAVMGSDMADINQQRLRKKICCDAPSFDDCNNDRGTTPVVFDSLPSLRALYANYIILNGFSA